MRSAKDFFRTKAIGAPQPLREIPFRPARMIHFFDPKPKMAAEAARPRAQCDVLLGNLEDAIQISNKIAAREGLAKIGRELDFGDCQLWTRVNSLDSPWLLDDLTTLVGEIGDKLDVIMIPKVEGPWDIHFVDQLLAQLEAKAGLRKPLLVHAILETNQVSTSWRMAAEPAHAGAPFGLADLAASWRMKDRVGGHPRTVRTDPTRRTPTLRASPRSRTRGTTRSRAWSTRAPRTGSTPTTDHSARSTTRSRARTSSAPRSCWVVWAHGASTPVRSTLRARCSAPRSTRCCGRRR
jgi:malyl-CoA/(S)-citramalyl-CoA lyase